MNGVIYLLTSPSGKQYIGQSWDYEMRMGKYRRGVGKYQPAIHAAIQKYGWGNFTATIIMRGIQTQPALDAAEDAFIMLLDTLVPNGYNLKRGGLGGKPSVESRKKMSAAHLGKKHSAETKAKQSAAHRGKKHKPMSAEGRANIGDAQRGKKRGPFSPEHRAKLSAAHRGKTLSPEHRANLSVASRARWSRPDERVKQSASQKARFARERQMRFDEQPHLEL